MKNSVRLAMWALVCLIFGCVSADAQTITTVIGGGPVGLTPTAASVGSPVAVRRDSLNNAYILDNNYGRVLKIDHTTGLMSVYAGNGTVGFSGDTHAATGAQMNAPSGMCFDSNDNLFIADSDNAVIRVVIGPSAVTPSSLTGPVTAGNIYTAVGIQTSTDPEYGGDNGPALSSHLHFPDGCSFDTHDNLYIADRGNNEVRVVIGTAAVTPPGLTGPLTPGSIYRFAGAAGGSFPTPPAGGYGADGTAAATAAVYGPFDVFVDKTTNNVYFADLGNNFGADGTPNTQTGQPNNNNVIREVLASDGTIHTVAGVAGTYSGATPTASGVATAVALNEPKGISVDGSGTLYFCDTINQVIRKVAAGNISVYAGTLTHAGYAGDGNLATTGNLAYPAGTFVDTAGDLFIADDVNNAVREVPATTGGGQTALHIYTIAGNGHFSYGGDNALATGGELNTPAGISADTSGNIIVADSGSDLIREASGSTGKLSTITGQPEANGFLNNPSTINGALGVASDASGNVYVADTLNCIVRKITAATGAIATFAGIEPTIVSTDNAILNTPHCGFTAQAGPAIGTGLGFINSVAVDSNGNVFFSDKTDNVIWEVPKTTVGTLLAGNAYIVAGMQSTTGAFSGDGSPANQARLSGPTGIYIDIYDNLFIADAANHRIREVPAVNVGSMTAGSIYTIAGNGTSGSTGDGAGATSAEIATPFGIVVDHAENVYFSDTTTQSVRVVAGVTAGGKTAGDIYTVAGTANAAGFGGDGAAATLAHLNVPQGLGLVPNGGNTTANLIISDSVNNRVRSVAGIANIGPVPLATLSPNPLNFNATPLVTASAAMAVTVTNSGGATLNVSGVTFGGTNAGDFHETDNCVTPGTVAAGASCTINVVFTPAAIGVRTATLTVADNAFGGSQTINVTGTGGTPTATLSPAALTFGSTVVGKSSAPQAVTLSNTGNVATVVPAGGVTITGTNAADFKETDTCAGTVGVLPGTTCAITVTFTPTAGAATTRTATLNVASNVGPASTATLTGTAGAATLTLTVTDTDPSPTQTVAAGSTATYNLSVSGNQSVTATIACTGAPTAAVCSAVPGSVAITPTAAGTFKVSVTTTARGEMLPFNQPSMKMQPPSFMQLVPMASLALLFLIAMMLGWMQNEAGRARTLRVALSLALILMPIAAATVLVGCGGGGGGSTPPPASGTPAGSYTLTVTATSGSTTSSTALTLVVN